MRNTQRFTDKTQCWAFSEGNQYIGRQIRFAVLCNIVLHYAKLSGVAFVSWSSLLRGLFFREMLYCAMLYCTESFNVLWFYVVLYFQDFFPYNILRCVVACCVVLLCAVFLVAASSDTILCCDVLCIL